MSWHLPSHFCKTCFYYAFSCNFSVLGIFLIYFSFGKYRSTFQIILSTSTHIHTHTHTHTLTPLPPRLLILLCHNSLWDYFYKNYLRFVMKILINVVMSYIILMCISCFFFFFANDITFCVFYIYFRLGK